jgi:alanyl-tRNA synthetase
MSFLNTYISKSTANKTHRKLSVVKKLVYGQELRWSTDKIRQTFLDYFCKEHQHKFIKSSSVLPKKGSGTYFTNAGMNQFKSIILSEMKADDIIDSSKYIGAANSQKCIRIGGKHNDLDDIGKDTYHHTFFEMLGNWSFGAYDTEKTCEMALDLLVNRYKLNIDGLYFTYFAGDNNLGLSPDLATKNTWLRLGVLENHILPFDMKCNFWEMDVVGPCGPCTEIHYDRKIDTLNSLSDKKRAAELVNAGTERVIELWNLVFMNYNRTGPKKFSKLPSQVVDTGMGLERLSAVLNNLESNYDTDLFLPLLNFIYEYSNQANKHNIQNYRNSTDADLLYSYRCLSDHMRSICVSISDGLMPSRNGLGGFLKYLILKCMKICKDTFRAENQTEMLCKMVPIVIGTLKNAYPELEQKTFYIQQVNQCFLKP